MPLLKPVLRQKEELGQEVISLGSDLNDGATVYALCLTSRAKQGSLNWLRSHPMAI